MDCSGKGPPLLGQDGHKNQTLPWFFQDIRQALRVREGEQILWVFHCKLQNATHKLVLVICMTTCWLSCLLQQLLAFDCSILKPAGVFHIAAQWLRVLMVLSFWPHVVTDQQLPRQHNGPNRAGTNPWQSHAIEDLALEAKQTESKCDWVEAGYNYSYN